MVKKSLRTGSIGKLALIILLSMALWFPQMKDSWAKDYNTCGYAGFIVLNGSGLSHSGITGNYLTSATGMGTWCNYIYFLINNAYMLPDVGTLYLRINFNGTSTSALRFDFTSLGVMPPTYDFQLNFIDFIVDGVNLGALAASRVGAGTKTITLTSAQKNNGYVNLIFRNNRPHPTNSLEVVRGSISNITVTAIGGSVDCGLRINDGDTSTGVTQPKIIACKENPGTTAADIAAYPLRIISSVKDGTSISPTTFGIELVDVPTVALPNPKATKVRVRVPGSTPGSTIVKALREF